MTAAAAPSSPLVGEDSKSAYGIAGRRTRLVRGDCERWSTHSPSPVISNTYRCRAKMLKSRPLPQGEREGSRAARGIPHSFSPARVQTGPVSRPRP